MKYLFIYLSLILIACSSDNNSIVSKPIDLQNQDSVKTYINGEWFILKNNIEIGYRRISSNPSDLHLTWYSLSQKELEDFKATGIEYIKSCPTYTSLIFGKDSTYIKFTGLGGSDTLSIKYLSKEKLILGKTEYVKK